MPDFKVNIRNVDDGHMIQVEVTCDGFHEMGFVSSMHLVDGKANQLKMRIEEQARAAFGEKIYDV